MFFVKDHALAVFALVSLVVARPVFAQDTGTLPVVTLEEAVQLALRVNPAVIQRQGGIQTAESAERTNGVAAYLPSLSFTSGASKASSQRFDPNTNTTVSGSSDSYSARLSTGVDLFTGFRRGAAANQARANTASAEAALVQTQFQTTLSAKQSFFNVLRADETIRSAQAALDRAQQGLRAAEQRLQVGSATRSDSLRAQLEVMRARQTLLSAENDKRAASYALGALIGYDGPVAADPSTSTSPQPLALGDPELIQLAVSRSPGVMMAEASHVANEAAIGVSRSQYYPSLTLNGGYTWNNDDPSFNGGNTSWNTGLSLSFPIFNRFVREDGYERAKVNARTTQFQLEDARRQARANARSAIDAVHLAEQQIVIAEEAVAVAAEDVRVQETRYLLGASTILDQITSQAALVSSELSLIAARYDYLIARAQLEALVGREL